MIKVQDHFTFNNIKGEFEFELNQVDQSKILNSNETDQECDSDALDMKGLAAVLSDHDPPHG